jgi:hypothetical protein
MTEKIENDGYHAESCNDIEKRYQKFAQDIFVHQFHLFFSFPEY